MAKIFYDHLVMMEEIIVVIDQHDLSPKERQELISLVDQTLHHHILDVILTHLPVPHHEAFLALFHKAPHDPQLLTFLKEKTAVDIEREIQKKAKTVKKSLISAITKSKNKGKLASK